MKTLRTLTLILVALLLIAPAPALAADRQNIYDESADSRADIQAALEKAKAENKHVLLQWGGNWCGWCHKLHALFQANEDIKQTLADKYVIVMIDTNNNRPLIEEMKSKINGVPFLTVLDADGKKLVDQETGSLEIGSEHDPAKVLAFLEKWSPNSESAGEADARAALQEGLTQARAQNKALFVDFSTEWCGWCKRLDELLSHPDVAPIINRHLVVLKIDQEKMTGGESLRKEMDKGSGGVPWYVILDGDGNEIISANRDGKNIGYPAREQEMAHFIAMIEKAGPNITDEEKATLRTTMEARAKEILSQ
ncbi:MAG: thioredoxin family protein [Candidatus Hydrogenedentales bacterium]